MNLLNVIARTSEGLGSGARMRVLLIVFQDWLVVLCFFPALKVLHGDPESKPSIGAICWWNFRASEIANRWPQAVDRRFMQWQSAPIERKVVSFVAWEPSVGNETIQDRPFLVAPRSWKRSCLKCHDVVCNSEYQLRWKEPVTLAMQSPYFWSQKSNFHRSSDPQISRTTFWCFPGQNLGCSPFSMVNKNTNMCCRWTPNKNHQKSADLESCCWGKTGHLKKKCYQKWRHLTPRRCFVLVVGFSTRH